jgi:hypothetical protein
MSHFSGLQNVISMVVVVIERKFKVFCDQLSEFFIFIITLNFVTITTTTIDMTF